VDFLDEGSASFQRYARPLSEHLAAADQSARGRLGLWILVGSSPFESDESRLANRTLFYQLLGKLVATTTRSTCIDTGVVGKKASTESNTFAPAIERSSQTRHSSLGPQHLLRHPLPTPLSDLAKAGAQILAVPANFLRSRCRALARTATRPCDRNRFAMSLLPLQCGECRPGNRSFGHSLIVTPGEKSAPMRTGSGWDNQADISGTRNSRGPGAHSSLSNDRPYQASELVQ